MDYSDIISSENPDLNTIILYRPQEKLSTELGRETIILDMDSGVYSQLNAVGTTVWNQLSQPVSFQAIVENVLALYDITELECRVDILKFLSHLAENNLIKVCDDKNS
jgi:hypothetical protein